MKKILVIDDEPGTIEAIRVVLQAAGYAVEAAEDGAAGLVRATEQLPDLVLCDLYLPTGTGLAVLKRLRAEQTTAALPFILMSGQDDGTTMRRGMALGADDFLVKPFNQESLLAAVEARLRRREVQEQAAQEVKERLVGVIEASADWVLMVDLPHQGITYCNSAAARALEMDGPMPGSRGHLADWMPSEALCCLNQEVLPQVLRQGWWLGETVFRTRTGREIPVRLQVRAHRAKEANLEYVSLVAHDLSASRQAQQQERENARHLRAILETAMDGFWELDLQGRLLQVNQSYCRMSGYQASELLAMHISDLETTATTAARIPQVMTQGEARFDTQHRRKDGSVFEVEIGIQFQPAAGGRFVAFLRDITERKQTDVQLQLRERQLRESQQVARLGSWDWDLTTAKLNWSGVTYELFDRSPETFAPSFEEFVRRVHPEDRATMQTDLDRALVSDDSPYHVAVRIINHSGREWVMEALGKVERDGVGRPRRILGTAQDITERQRAEAELRQVSGELRSVIESSQDLIAMMDRQHRYTLFNSAFHTEFKRIFGRDLTPGDSMLRALAHLPEDLAAATQLWNRVLGGEDFTITQQFGDTHLERCWYELHFSPVRDQAGQVIAGVHVVRNVTERKQMEMALQESQRRLTFALDQSRLAYWEMDAETEVFTFNDRFYELYATTAEREGGYQMPVAVYARNFLPPEEQHLVLEDVARLGAGDLDEFQREHRIRRRDGELRHIAVRVSVFRDATGRVVGMRGSNQDITRRKQAEAYQEMGREVVRLLNEPDPLREALPRILATLKSHTGFDAVGLRLQAEEDFPFFVQDGFSQEFLETENTLVMRTKEGGPCRNPDGSVSLECTCGLVLSGKTDPSHPLFTRSGSCWTNDSFPLLKIPAHQDPRLHPRNQCIHQGYASVALIPIRSSGRILGLIQFNDRRPGRFTPAFVELLEGIAAHVGSALMRREAEELLRASEARFRAVTASATDAIISANNAGNIVSWNCGAARIFGYTETEICGQPMTRLIPDRYQEGHLAGMARMQTGGARRVIGKTVELTGRHREGHEFPLELSLGEWQVAEGWFYTAIIRDITERKQAEAKRSSMELQLRQAQKLESIGQLAAGIAHEINTPTQYIGDNTRFLESAFTDLGGGN